jgi:hypothetical protein
MLHFSLVSIFVSPKLKSAVVPVSALAVFKAINKAQTAL